jgi:hypothetical protein
MLNKLEGIAVLAIVAALGLSHACAYYEGRTDGKSEEAGNVAAANAAVAICDARSRDLSAALNTQNDQVATFAGEATRIAAEGAAALKRAQAETLAARADVARILATPRPAPGNECRAAEALIATEMGE